MKLINIFKNILNWYYNNKRDFPWRNTTDPYKIMIAEFMLHRTKAAQVVPVYIKFIKKYPDVFSLSEARKDSIKKVTEHLGLHWRSHHFIESAKFVIDNYNGIFPDNPDELFKVPGIGEYVAGAIITVCFNKVYPVVDSNIARFINRYSGLNLEGEIRRKKEIINISSKLFDTEKPGEFLFAIVDFTSLVCKPLKPECKSCIINTGCIYYNKQ